MPKAFPALPYGMLIALPALPYGMLKTFPALPYGMQCRDLRSTW